MAEPLVYTNRMAIEKFNRTRGVPKDGAQLILPDIGQVHTVVGKLFWKYRDRFPIVNVSLVFEAPCAVCGAPFRYNLPWRLQYRLMRTCEAHRGQWRSPEPKRYPNRRSPFVERVSRMLLAEVRQHGSISFEGAVISIASKIERNPDALQDCRRGNTRQAIRTMIERRRLPKGIRVSETHFLKA